MSQPQPIRKSRERAVYELICYSCQCTIEVAFVDVKQASECRCGAALEITWSDNAAGLKVAA